MNYKPNYKRTAVRLACGCSDEAGPHAFDEWEPGQVTECLTHGETTITRLSRVSS